MNIKEYIESGIVATYVLGLASETEQKEFEDMCRLYPELIDAKNQFEIELEERLIGEAVPVPNDLKEKILSVLDNKDAGNRPTNDQIPIRKITVWKMLAAACMLLLVCSIYFVYSFREKYQKLLIKDNALSALSDSENSNPFKSVDAILKKPTVKWSAMLEPKDSSHCMAHVYWDSVSTNTFLLIGNIPDPVSDKQFQLWAWRNNHAVNLGIFDIKKQGQVIQMKNVQKVKMFVITLEPKGGSSSPSMEAVYAIGKI